MNSISWLLYGAEVTGNLRGVLIGGAVASGMAAGGCAVIAGVIRGSYCPDEDEIANSKWLLARARPLATACVLLAVLAAAMPSRGTVLLIAASELGESVLTSEQAQQIGGEAGVLASDSLRVLRKFINEQLAASEED